MDFFLCLFVKLEMDRERPNRKVDEAKKKQDLDIHNVAVTNETRNHVVAIAIAIHTSLFAMRMHINKQMIKFINFA